MRFTKELVRRVSDCVEEFTRGAFALEDIGSDIGNGVRYMDAHTGTVWLGPKGARSACAYYIGAMLGHARATATHISPEDMHLLKAVQDSYAIGSDPGRTTYRQWEENGYQAAQNRAA